MENKFKITSPLYHLFSVICFLFFKTSGKFAAAAAITGTEIPCDAMQKETTLKTLLMNDPMQPLLV